LQKREREGPCKSREKRRREGGGVHPSDRQQDQFGGVRRKKTMIFKRDISSHEKETPWDRTKGGNKKIYETGFSYRDEREGTKVPLREKEKQESASGRGKARRENEEGCDKSRY